jgi:hypothetical protein
MTEDQQERDALIWAETRYSWAYRCDHCGQLIPVERIASDARDHVRANGGKIVVKREERP